MKANEELFEKTLVPLVEDILKYRPRHLSVYSSVYHTTHTLAQEGRRDW